MDKPEYIFAAPVPYAMLKAAIKFAGANRRRFKRELNKAAKRAGRKQREHRL